MVYGIDYKLFWHLNPTKMKPFRKAYEEKCKQDDFNAWNTGRYVMEAIASCFGKHTYTEQPYTLKNEVEKAEGLSDAEKFAMWAKKFNKAKKDKEG